MRLVLRMCWFFFFFKQKTAYEMRISDRSSDVCSSDLCDGPRRRARAAAGRRHGGTRRPGAERDVTERVDAVVIGAGAVGLACARALALQAREVLVLEKAEAIGTATSSRHSEVIHSGIYYPLGSLKARFWDEGKTKLYRYPDE